MLRGITAYLETLLFIRPDGVLIAQCPMDNSPGGVSKEQMKELGLKLDVVK